MQFSWQVRHFRRVALHVFLRIALSGLQVTWWQLANRVWGFWRVKKLTDALHETSISINQLLGFIKKLVGKRRLCSYKLWKFEDVSCEVMLVLSLWHVSSRFSGCGVPVHMGEAAKPFLKVSKEVVIWLCVAGVALCDIPTCFITTITRRRSFCLTGTILNTFEMLSEDDLHFFAAGAALSRHFRRVVLRVFANCNVSAASSGDNVQSVWETAKGSFRGRRRIWWSLIASGMPLCVAGKVFGDVATHHCRVRLDPPNSIFHCPLDTPHPQPTLYTFHSIHFTLCFTLRMPHFTFHILHSPLRIPHSTLHSTVCTLHSTLHTLYALHFKLRTPHSTFHTTLYTPHFTLHAEHCRLDTSHAQCTLHTLHSRVHSSHSALYIPHATLHTPHTTLYIPHCALQALYFTLYTPHFTLHTPHFTLYTTLYITHSTLYTSRSALRSLHFTTLCTPHFTLHALHFTLRTLHSPLPTSHSTLYTAHLTLQPGCCSILTIIIVIIIIMTSSWPHHHGDDGHHHHYHHCLVIIISWSWSRSWSHHHDHVDHDDDDDHPHHHHHQCQLMWNGVIMGNSINLYVLYSYIRHPKYVELCTHIIFLQKGSKIHHPLRQICWVV